MTGIGDEHAEMFANPLWQQLHTKIVRYIAPYDAAVHPYSLDQATRWIRAAEAQHQQVLVAFYHSEYTPTKMPSVATYQTTSQKFVKLFPHVRQYQSWDEANRGNVTGTFSSPSAVARGAVLPGAAARVQGLHGDRPRRARRSTTSPRRCATSRNSSARSATCETVMPKIWGLHNYSDINRLESWRTRELVARPRRPGVADRDRRDRAVRRRLPEQHGSGLTRAAKVLKYMFAVAGLRPADQAPVHLRLDRRQQQRPASTPG